MYVGAIPTTGDFKVLDSITTSSATTFNLRQGGVAVYPQSANHCLVVLNGVLQTAGSSFNIVNDTIVFASSLASSDVINQILVLGNVNDIGVPSDDTVSTAKLQSSAVTDAKISAMASSKLTGVVPTANLGSGTASSSTVLFGDQTFKTAPSGGLVPIRQSSGSSNTTNVIVNGWISDTYENYVMDYYFNVATNNEAISMTLYDSSGNISSGNEYNWTHIGSQASDGAKVELYNSSQNAFRLCHGANNDSARVSVTGRLTWLHPRASGKRTTILHHQRQLNNSAVVQSFIGALEFKATNQLTGFYCNATSGDISGWDINIYGIVNS
ncbi:hypothetical protein [uncultured Mediterranean phage uvMED]|nr:hypothetical protein [uncultured Mediterranean phage uvMED]BAR37067.1 hypothetical protein [uncultured Mediterranean phage uvMED]